MKKLSTVLAVVALVATGCDPWQDAPKGDPAIVDVNASGRLIDPIAGSETVGGWALDSARVLPVDPNADGEVSDAEAAANVAAAATKGVPVGAGANNVVVIKTNKLLDGATIQTAPQDPTVDPLSPAALGDCRPAGNWLTITKSVAGGAAAAEPLNYVDPAGGSNFQWYSCYYPAAASNRLGASIEIFRARVDTAPGLTTATRPLSIARLEPDATYTFSGTVQDDSGKPLEINLTAKTALRPPALDDPTVNSATSVTLTWTAPAGAAGTLTYDVYRSVLDATGADTGTMQSLATGLTATTFTDTTATGGHDYTYYVTVSNERSRSEAASAAATTP